MCLTSPERFLLHLQSLNWFILLFLAQGWTLYILKFFDFAEFNFGLRTGQDVRVLCYDLPIRISVVLPALLGIEWTDILIRRCHAE
jgi:hypothetical protein